MRSRFLLPVVLALPGLALGATGLLHPHTLTPATADRWYLIHLAGLVVFPLVGVALAALMRGRQDPVAWFVRLTAYGFAVFYTALDVIYGVAAGNVTRQMEEGYRRSADFTAMLRTGVDLGEVGSWSLVVCGLALVVDQLGRHRLDGLPALGLPIGGWLVHQDHIFAPTGVAGMLVVGLATGLLARNLPKLAGNQVQPLAR
ncbi:hypothetical protein [Nocardioides sp.]|uniref:hypothetical protein n=1 Tax=Nocardioides sp. TaxID=35761 RepID=UPI002717CBC2|nr:hypothetical protein [Nocardioides sp.]MDO9456704.1 hypothetical protein [Nocardioides sp.]